MTSIFQKFETWRQTTLGLVISVIMELILSYLFISLAIDTGSLLDYALSILIIALTCQDGFHLFQSITRNPKHGKK